MRRKQSATVDLKIRMKEPLRAAIERAAKRRGVSMNAEAVDRLERSFSADDALGGPETATLLRMLAATVKVIETKTDGTILSDYRTFRYAMNAWQRVVEHLGPGPTPEIAALQAQRAAEDEKVGANRNEVRIAELTEEIMREENRIIREAQTIGRAAMEQVTERTSR